MTNINNQLINSNIEIQNLKDSELIINKKSKDYLLTEFQINSEINFDTRSELETETETENELNLESDTESTSIIELITDSDIEYDSEIDDYINKNKIKNI